MAVHLFKKKTKEAYLSLFMFQLPFVPSPVSHRMRQPEQLSTAELQAPQDRHRQWPLCDGGQTGSANRVTSNDLRYLSVGGIQWGLRAACSERETWWGPWKEAMEGQKDDSGGGVGAHTETWQGVGAETRCPLCRHFHLHGNCYYYSGCYSYGWKVPLNKSFICK